MTVRDTEDSISSDRSNVDLTDIQSALSQEYGIEAVKMQSLGGEVDHNVFVTNAEGHKFLVKLTPAVFSEKTVLWQEAILEHLASKELHVDVPSAVRSVSGFVHCEVSVGNERYLMRVFNWIEGEMLAKHVQQPGSLLRELGRVAAEVTLALEGLSEHTGPEEHHWLVTRSHEAVRASIEAVTDPQARREVQMIMGWFDACRESFEGLPKATVHQDINDFNTLVSRTQFGDLRISGILDFNDARYTIRVAEVAVAVAYSMLRKTDPLSAAAEVVAGYNELVRLTPEEISVIFPLAAARLCVNATIWTKRTVANNHAYGESRKHDTWPAIAKIAQLHPKVAEVRFREACGLPALDDRYRVDAASLFQRLSPVTGDGIFTHFDLSPTSELFDEIELETNAIGRHLATVISHSGPREIYYSPSFTALLPKAARRDVGTAEPATIQLGTGLIASERRTLLAPANATVVGERGANRPVILKHESVGELPFYSLWWGVESDLTFGTEIAAGQAFATLPAFDAGNVVDLFSGMVQIAVDPGFLDCLPPCAIRPSEVDYWRQLSPDPSLFLLLPESNSSAEWSIEKVLDVRDRKLAPSQKSYYHKPMNLVRGRGVWLYDENAFKYLDPINNVTHIGHADARVVAAGVHQMRQLNTNSRLVYPGIAHYAERLTNTLPTGLDIVFFVCTGSEANDLALRIARQVTGRQHMIVIDSAYHGNTTAVMGVSPNRYKAPGGGGTPPTTREVMTPDRYRGPYGYDDLDAGSKYAQNVRDVVARMVSEETPPAAFIAESLIGTGGNYILPPGYLQESFRAVRAAGGLCIADEVQVGFGRLGSKFWGFETHGVVPDIVTLGKPMGNGHPMAAVVTTREIAEAFDDGVKYFNTFGGNPVSCAIGMSVLDVVEQDGLQAHAEKVGLHFKRALKKLKDRHPLIGDVRGQGLYLGVEIVRDLKTKEPGDREALIISEMLKDRGVIMYPNGRYNNVLKLKPPMVFQQTHVEIVVSQLDRVLSELEAMPSSNINGC